MAPSTATTTRWCPTPEQLMILEELYRRGLRTPTAAQIQRITAHLSLYGAIQGKNVFYWFQNHKARDRQKLRKKLAKQLHEQHHQLLHHNHPYIFNDLHHFHNPPPLQQLPNFYSAQNLIPQVPEELMRQTWMGDLPKDWLTRSYGQDSMMMGPTFPCCRSKPLETLELFPLNSPPLKNEPKITTSYFDDPPPPFTNKYSYINA